MSVSRTNVGLFTASVVIGAAWMLLPGCSDETASLPEEQASGGAAGQGGVTEDSSVGGSGGTLTGGSSGAANGGSAGSSAGGVGGAGNGGASAGGTGGSTPDAGTGGAVQVDAAPDTEPEASAPVCATTSHCEAQWANDPCKANVVCDGATSTCKFTVLDKDGDGHPPVVCGGDDCDDSSNSKFPGNPESCDEMDNDCDKEIDENAVCSAPEGPSCAGGLDCGGVSCCDNRAVPGGDFLMGRSDAETLSECKTPSDCYANELPEHSVHVTSFYLDTFEVTVGRLRNFVEQYDGSPPAAGAGQHPFIPGTGWSAEWNSRVLSKADLLDKLRTWSTEPIWTDTPGSNENKPANNIDWVLAFQFCLWDGGRLPTEAEWEYAAAGGQENRVYPWGSTAPSPERAVYGCLFEGSADCSSFDVAPVGSKPLGQGRWGHKDLAGSIRELVYDAYSAVWYGGSGAICNDCANTWSTPDSRVSRGGGWAGIEMWPLRAASRKLVSFSSSSYGGTSTTGVRCARD